MLVPPSTNLASLNQSQSLIKREDPTQEIDTFKMTELDTKFDAIPANRIVLSLNGGRAK